MNIHDFCSSLKGDGYAQIVQKGRKGKAEENIKVHIVDKILRDYLNYTAKDLDFEHDSKGKRIDIAVLQANRAKLIIEVKDDKNLTKHVPQAHDYARTKAVSWYVLTNGITWQIYAYFIAGIEVESERLLFEFSVFDQKPAWEEFRKLLGREELLDKFGYNLDQRIKEIKPRVTSDLLMKELQYAKDILFNDLSTEFISKYETSKKFKKEIDQWALKTKLDVTDPSMINKLCMEGAYSLINRVLLYRICECKGSVKKNLNESSIRSWQSMVSAPSGLLRNAFSEGNNFYADFFNFPLFDNIRFEDVSWNELNIHEILSRLSSFDFSEIDEDIIGSAYEKHLSIENRKKIGQYYTPGYVVDYMLEQVQLEEGMRILDPACGSGGFLMKAFDLLSKKNPQLPKIDILKKSIYGSDINPFATQLTKVNLFLKSYNFENSQYDYDNIATADSLAKSINRFKKVSQKKENIDTSYSNSFINYVSQNRDAFGKLQKEGKFDLVIGNPPYICLGAWKSAEIDHEYSEDLQDFLTEYYSKSAEYKISTYAVFIERALELTKENGIVSFIIPDSFLAGKYSSKLRRMILEQSDILEILVCKEDFWKDAQVGFPVILKIKKVKNEERELREKYFGLTEQLSEHEKKLVKLTSASVRKKFSDKILVIKNELEKLLQIPLNTNLITVNFAESADDIIKRKFNTQSVAQNSFHSNHNLRFTLFESKKLKKIYDKINLVETKVKDFMKVECGIYGKNGKDSILSTIKHSKYWFEGVSDTSLLHEFYVDSNVQYLKFKKEDLIRGFNVNYSNPKLLLPKTADRIRCSYDKEGLIADDNCQIVTPRPDFENYLPAFCAILNSDLFNEYYRIVTLETGRGNAQTDIDTLYSIPFPSPNDFYDQYTTLNDKALEIIKLLKKKKKTKDEMHKTKRLKVEIENIVTGMFLPESKRVAS